MNVPLHEATSIRDRRTGRQPVDQDALVLGIVNGHDDKLHSALSKCSFEDCSEVFGGLDSSSIRSIGPGVLDEVRVFKGETEISEALRLLFPADHAIPSIFEDKDDEVK